MSMRHDWPHDLIEGRSPPGPLTAPAPEGADLLLSSLAFAVGVAFPDGWARAARPGTRLRPGRSPHPCLLDGSQAG